MLAVGGQLLGSVDEQTLKMTTGLSGGVGLTHCELCGALSSGVLVIGALHGRTRPEEDDAGCQELAARYRRNFEQTLGSTNCETLRRAGDYETLGRELCARLVERAVHVLFEVLDGEDNRL